MSTQFQTKLENPTTYYVYKTQERQLKEYLKQHGSASPQAFTPPTSQATLNAINNMSSLPNIADGLGITGAMKPPDSPMSAASSTEPSEVSNFAKYNLYRVYQKKGNRTLQCSSAFIIQSTGIILSQAERPGF